jgi:phosphatidate phosphatase LPIN
MKIGEAGEAFFIFETAGDVPDELITSPLLEATHSPGIQGQDAQAAGEGKDQHVQLQESEPDFLDLDAPPMPPASSQSGPISILEAEGEDEKDSGSSLPLFSRAAALGASIGNAVLEKERNESLKAKERAKAIYRTTQDIVHHGTTDPNDISPSREPESMPPEPIYNDGA